jgi:23S rRNA pseudouridine1911/1915/1917 synthase
MEQITRIVDESSGGTRIDAYVSEGLPLLSRTAAQRLCEEGLVLVDGVAAPKNLRLKAGQTVEITLPPPKDVDAKPENIPLEIVYEDDDLLVVNKQKGMVAHPAPGNESGTLVNALLFHCGDSLSGIGGAARPGIVHRIDKDTSGLLVVAKSDLAHQSLTEQLSAHTVMRRYHAVVHGGFKTDSGRVDAPIGRHPTDRKRMCVTERNSRDAATNYTVLEELNRFTYVMCELETGRTHQIRVHMAYIGHPVAGDPVYGPRSAAVKRTTGKLEGQCLHAKTLGFLHPRTGEYLEFTSELPEYFAAFLKSVRITG